MIYCTLALGLCFLIAFLIKCRNQRSVEGVFIKTGASIFFILTGVVGILKNPTQYQYGVMFLSGFVFGLLGDIYLDQKWVYPEDDNKYLFAGFVFFAIGHAFYIPAMVMASGFPLQSLWIPAAAGIAVLIFVAATEKPTKQDFGKFRWILYVYTFIVASMAGTAVCAAIYTKTPAFIVTAVGSVFFLLSDIILSPMYFGPVSKRNPTNFVINHVTYYLGQYLFAVSISLLPAIG